MTSQNLYPRTYHKISTFEPNMWDGSKSSCSWLCVTVVTFCHWNTVTLKWWLFYPVYFPKDFGTKAWLRQPMAGWLTGYSWKREKWRGLELFSSVFHKISISASCLYFTQYLEGITETPNKYPVFFYIKSFTTQHFRKSDFITCLYIFPFGLNQSCLLPNLNEICPSLNFSLILNSEARKREVCTLNVSIFLMYVS